MNRLVSLILVITSLGCGSFPSWDDEIFCGPDFPNPHMIDLTASPEVARVGELVTIEVVFHPEQQFIRDPFTGDVTDECAPIENYLMFLLPLGLEYVTGSAELDSGLEPSIFNKIEADFIVTCGDGTPPLTLPVNVGRQGIRFDFPRGSSLTTNIARLRFQALVSEPSGVVEIEASRRSVRVPVCRLRGDGLVDRRRSLELLQ